MGVKIEPAYDRLQEVIRLFAEYRDSIVSEDPEVEKCLNSQHYENELRDLGEKYGLPNGRLYLAYLDGELAGCIALRRLDADCCEMKRLYVRPEYRGKQIGKVLMDQIMEDAKQIGYKHIRLDTFPFMERAIWMYGRYGFYKIDCYNDNPAFTAVFMQKDL